MSPNVSAARSPTTEQAEFWSRVATDYDRVVDQQIGLGTRALVRERVAREGRLGRVVEFGCGTGFFTPVLATRAESLLATDVSPGMLELARNRIDAHNVTFQVEDCQATSLGGGAFDTAFISLVMHFTEPERTVREMHRILVHGGTLVIVNLDPRALRGLDLVRGLVRIFYQGAVGYRRKPPRGFGRNVMSEQQLSNLLARVGFRVLTTETIRDPSRSSHIPLEYVRALKT